jgi:hypothetical protein
MTDRLQYRLQHERDNGLGDTIADRGHTEYPLSSGFLGYRHCLYRRREIAPRRHPIPDPVEMTALIRLEHLDRLTINSAGVPPVLWTPPME